MSSISTLFHNSIGHHQSVFEVPTLIDLSYASALLIVTFSVQLEEFIYLSLGCHCNSCLVFLDSLRESFGEFKFARHMIIPFLVFPLMIIQCSDAFATLLNLTQ